MRRRRIRYGQHMLVSPTIANQFIDSCDLGQNSRVLEIGSGRGILTQKIADKAAFVKSFEVDRALFEATERLVSSYKNVQLIHADAFAYDLKNEKFDVCITSLPYSESLRFIKWLALRASQFKLTAVIVQSEFAMKLIANPSQPSYRAVSVVAQISFEIKTLFNVGRDSFSPPPRVESSAVHIIPTSDVSLPFFNEERIRILDFIFSFRGRHLSSALKKLLPGKNVGNLFDDILAARVETISPMDYMKIIQQAEKIVE
jgi:16S rRNA (adenine1518-N6/adenine1519-N6)-dimethyltransferase